MAFREGKAASSWVREREGGGKTVLRSEKGSARHRVLPGRESWNTQPEAVCGTPAD